MNHRTYFLYVNGISLKSIIIFFFGGSTRAHAIRVNVTISTKRSISSKKFRARQLYTNIQLSIFSNDWRTCVIVSHFFLFGNYFRTSQSFLTVAIDNKTL